MATSPFQYIVDKQRLQGGQASLKKKGTQRYLNLGAVPVGEFQPNIAEVESWSQESGFRELIGVFNVSRDGTLNLTLESYTELAFEIAFMAEKKYLTQEASTFTIDITDLEDGYIFKIDGINPTVVSFTNNDPDEPVSLTQGNHFTAHETGFVEVLSRPTGFGTVASVQVSLPEITEADKLLDLGVMSTSGVRGELVIVGMSESTNGAMVEWTFWDVELRPTGPISAFNNETVNQIQIQGRVFAVAGKGPGKSYGQMRSLSKI